MAEALEGTLVTKVEAQDMVEGDNLRVYENGVQEGTWHKVVAIRNATLPCVNCGLHTVKYLAVSVEGVDDIALMDGKSTVKICR